MPEEELVTITLQHSFMYNGRQFNAGENQVHPRMVRVLLETDEGLDHQLDPEV